MSTDNGGKKTLALYLFVAVVCVVLKLTIASHWPWWLILAPAWLPLPLAAIAVYIMMEMSKDIDSP